MDTVGYTRTAISLLSWPKVCVIKVLRMSLDKYMVLLFLIRPLQISDAGNPS